MNNDRIEGTVEKAVGKVQEAAGKVMNDDGHRIEGMARQVSGTAQDLYGQAYDQVKSVACDMAERVEKNPMGAVLVAGLAGYVLGLLSRSSRH